MNKWQKILLGVSGGLLAAASFIPGAAVITVPVIGKIATAVAVKGAAAFLAGVAVKTPGHTAVVDAAPKNN